MATEARPTLDTDIYIPISEILAISKYDTIAAHKADPSNVFEGFSRYGDDKLHWFTNFLFLNSPLHFDCSCKFEAGDSDECTCGASHSILPLYQITAKNNGLHYMDDDTDAPDYVPELVTYLVHPQERERMSLLIAGHDPMVDLVNELRYNPTSGRLMEAAREDFESATKRARVL